ncbi:OmpA family protein [Hymenobacter profundi]|uniref:OmpA family protein n=1 Tax=Hymenobacter profundi TaxID=1982110 RepID=A0ABS6WYY3_9BACT|nr:OmpA family protein [Hymenobacter profundi]MBW3128802.1 OmpA family protein [Hymenobacter profundi]
MKSPNAIISLCLALMLFLSSCATSRNPNIPDANGTGPRKTGMNKTTKGGLLGAGGGAVVGGVLGRVIGGSGGTAAGAIIGAAVGGGAGALIGRKMDKQAEELQRDMQNAKVERVGEGIKVTFDSGILFDTNKSDLRPASMTEIQKMAATLKKYPDTNILVEGHTDNTGTDAINDPLSLRRAQAVANYTQTQGVDASRITTNGYGSKQPIADNSTEAGRQANRRVEIAIFANEKMKKAAENGTL